MTRSTFQAFDPKDSSPLRPKDFAGAGALDVQKAAATAFSGEELNGHGHGSKSGVARGTDASLDDDDESIDDLNFALDLRESDLEAAREANDLLVSTCRALYALCGENPEAQRLMDAVERLADL